MAKITVMFGTEPQSERTLDRDELRVGRAMDCDIVVDNLGVSRHHCSIVREGDQWVIVDQGSNNGTFMNGAKIDRRALADNDRIVLGKHTLVFDAHGQASARGLPGKGASGMGGEMTMFVDQAQLAKMAAQQSAEPIKRMALALHQGGREVVIQLIHDEIAIGKGAASEVPVKGFLVKPVQAKVVKSASGGHRLIALGGIRSVRVNGTKVTEAVLKAGDSIAIAGTTMTYRVA